jgi:hypothetical protein
MKMKPASGNIPYIQKRINEISLKRTKVWEVKDAKAEKIFKFYAEKLKFVKGE